MGAPSEMAPAVLPGGGEESRIFFGGGLVGTGGGFDPAFRCRLRALPPAVLPCE